MEQDVATGNSNKIRHWIFTILCFLPFVLLPLLSLDTGISGDEPVHYLQAENVYNFFATRGKDTSSINTPITYLKYYGQSIDNFSYLINKIFGFNEPYLTRHVINSLAGALTIAFTGLLAVEIAGYGAGILAILFLLLSPVFLGHTFNNLKDIPFALGYVVAIFYLLKFLRRLPVIHIGYLAGMVAGTGFAISVRVGGLVIIPIILAFTAIQAWIRQPLENKAKWKFAIRLALSLLITILLACIAGVVNWPFGLQNPIRHSIESLNQMTHYIVSIRQLFEGELYWSENLPWYYAPKYFLLISPAIILAGLPLCWPLLKKQGPLLFSLLVFCALFPLFWVIIRHSNLYGNIRHLLFIYPFLVVLSASGWYLIHQRLKKPLFRWGIVGLLALGLTGPLVHIVKNHPVEYVYFNRLSGGVSRAYGRYETDYYFNSLGLGVKWLEKEILSKPGADTLIIASNFPVEPFFEKSFPKIKTVYTTWYERGRYNWDYGLFVNAYLGPSGLQRKLWQPAQTIHSISVEGYPMCLVLHREDKRDVQGYQLFTTGRYPESASILKAVTRDDPGNETAWLYLGWSLRKIHDPEGSDQAANKLLRIHPESEPARELLIWNYLDSKRFDQALQLADELYRLNPKYLPAITLRAAARDSVAALAR
ncbi:MAG: glycosyltransferase family 39 protein [Bacteroidales bacterium]